MKLVLFSYLFYRKQTGAQGDQETCPSHIDSKWERAWTSGSLTLEFMSHPCLHLFGCEASKSMGWLTEKQLQLDKGKSEATYKVQRYTIYVKQEFPG